MPQLEPLDPCGLSHDTYRPRDPSLRVPSVFTRVRNEHLLPRRTRTLRPLCHRQKVWGEVQAPRSKDLLKERLPFSSLLSKRWWSGKRWRFLRDGWIHTHDFFAFWDQSSLITVEWFLFILGLPLGYTDRISSSRVTSLSSLTIVFCLCRVLTVLLH